MAKQGHAMGLVVDWGHLGLGGVVPLLLLGLSFVMVIVFRVPVCGGGGLQGWN